MAIVSTSIRMPLDERRTLYVVREDRNSEVILSLVENGTSVVTKRTTISLSIAQAIDLARTLANVATHTTDTMEGL